MKHYLVTSLVAGLSLLGAQLARAQTIQAELAQSRLQSMIAQKTETLRAQWARLVAEGKAPSVITEPSLVAGKVLTPRIFVGRPPGAPEVELELDAGTVGIDGVSVVMTSPSGAHTESADGVRLPLYPPQTRHTKFVLQISSSFVGLNFGIYSEAGNWSVQQVLIFSKDGKVVGYNGSYELAPFFPSTVVQIVNPTPDITPPTFGSGGILTPTVSLSSNSPTFVASLAVADNLSGVGAVALVISTPGTGYTQDAYLSLPAPLLKGTVYPGLSFNAQSVTGTYTITDFSVCDNANNCVGDNSAADIKKIFGATTFEVTQ
jgi:hypothetical protein